MHTNSHSTWLKRNWFHAIIALSVAVIAGSLFYHFVLRPKSDICMRRFLFWEWREKDCNVIDEIFN